MVLNNHEIFNKKIINVLKKSLNLLSSSERRKLLGELALEIEHGGKTFIYETFGISRKTLNKGVHEVQSGIKCIDNFKNRGRKSYFESQPTIIAKIKEILKNHSQTDPTFKSDKMYTRLTLSEIRERLSETFIGKELPCLQTISTILTQLGYGLKTIDKTKPIKKIPEVDIIFNTLEKLHDETDKLDDVVRISIDCKDRVKLGKFSRGGKSRLGIKAVDHDFCSNYTTPFGILDVKKNDIYLSLSNGVVTADYIVDRIVDFWLDSGYFSQNKTLLINMDNGPENNSRRTQFMKRIVEFSDTYNVNVILAYYPPYHSKYNKIERVWGHLEQHWNCDLLDSLNKVMGYCKTLKWHGKTPIVKLIEKVYPKKKKLTKVQMEFIEKNILRVEKIEKWLVFINSNKAKFAMDKLA